MNLSNICLTLSGTLTYIFYIFIALVALLLMITIHEFGHFIAGRKLGFKINEFAVGFGKILWKRKTKDGIIVSLRLIPLGGYCSFDGEDIDSKDPNAFNNKEPWKRLIVLFNGAFFNFLSAVLISFIMLFTFGYGDLVQVKKVEDYATNLIDVTSPIGDRLQEGDIIYAINGVETNFLNDKYFVSLMSEIKVGTKFTIKVKRDGEFRELKLINGKKFEKTAEGNFRLLNGDFVSIEKSEKKFVIKLVSDPTIIIANVESKDDDELFTFVYKDHKYVFDKVNSELYSGYLGISIQNYVHTVGEAFVKAVPFTCEWAWKILLLLWQIISGQMGLDGVGGPITTIGAMATYTQASWINLLILFPLISVNLAVFNLLPFPALDGARMVFVLIEWIRGKPINRNIEGYIHSFGLIILFAFVIIVDALKLFS